MRTSTGERKKLSDLRTGEHILALDESTRQFVYSEVLMFLDRNVDERREFLRLHTTFGKTVTLTPAHMVIRGDVLDSVFAEELSVGDKILVRDSDGQMAVDTILRIQPVLSTGVFAPLTVAGTIVVDDVVASCYAIIDSQTIAHWSFAPLRLAVNLKHGVYRLWQMIGRPVKGWSMPNEVSRESLEYQGTHWYARMLYSVAKYIIPSHLNE